MTQAPVEVETFSPLVLSLRLLSLHVECIDAQQTVIVVVILSQHLF